MCVNQVVIHFSQLFRVSRQIVYLFCQRLLHLQVGPEKRYQCEHYSVRKTHYEFPNSWNPFELPELLQLDTNVGYEGMFEVRNIKTSCRFAQTVRGDDVERYSPKSVVKVDRFVTSYMRD